MLGSQTNYGQWGNGTATNSTVTSVGSESPTAVANLRGWRYFVLWPSWRDGTDECWGPQNDGQWGRNGTATN